MHKNLQFKNIFSQYHSQYEFRAKLSTSYHIANSTNYVTSKYILQWVYSLISKRLSIPINHIFYGIRGILEDFLKSYLFNISQFVSPGNIKTHDQKLLTHSDHSQYEYIKLCVLKLK